MKKGIIVLILLLLVTLTGCREQVEPRPLPYPVIITAPDDWTDDYNLEYEDDEVKIYKAKQLTSVNDGDVSLHNSSCVMDGLIYDRYLITIDNGKYTINEYLKYSMYHTVIQLVDFGLPITCTNPYVDGDTKVGPNTNVGYIEFTVEVDTINEYRLFHFPASNILELDVPEELLTIGGTTYQVEAGGLEKLYFILVEDTFYSLEDAIELGYLSKIDIIIEQQKVPVLFVTEVYGDMELSSDTDYCFYADTLYEYCVDSIETYQSITIDLEGESSLLKDALHAQKYQVLGLSEIKTNGRSFEIIHSGTYKYSRRVTGAVMIYDLVYHLVAFDNTVDVSSVRSIYGKDMYALEEGYCMINDEIFHQYGLLLYGLTLIEDDLIFDTEPDLYSIKTILHKLTKEEVETLLNITCDNEIYTYNDFDYFVSYKDDTITAIWRPWSGGDVPAFVSYTDNNENFCTQSSGGMESNFIIVDGVRYQIQEALNLGILQGYDLYKYAFPKCVFNWPNFNVPGDICSENTEGCLEDYHEIYAYELNGHILQAMKNYTQFEDLPYTYITHNNITYINFGYVMNGFYGIEVNNSFYTLQEAIDNNYITFEDVLAIDMFDFVAYKITE